jgi:plastocyanin
MLKQLFVGVMVLGLSAFAAGATVGCGGDDPTDLESEGTGSDDDTPNYTVIATDFEFSVDELEVAAGEFILEFDNQGEVAHTYSIYTDAEYSDLAETTGNQNAGERNRHEMSLDAGEYFVRCDVHPTQMEATLVAE